MIHSSVKAQDTNPGWPADQMVDIAHRSRCRCRAILIREHGEQVIISPVVTLCDSKHKPASTLKMCTWHHLIQMSYQIRNCRGGSMIWGPDRPVRAVIILLQEEIWIFASGVFVSAGVLWVNVSHQNFAEADIYTHQNFCDCFGLAISKRSTEEDDWAQLSVVLKLTYNNLCVFAFSIGLTPTDVALNEMKDWIKAWSVRGPSVGFYLEVHSWLNCPINRLKSYIFHKSDEKPPAILFLMCFFISSIIKAFFIWGSSAIRDTFECNHAQNKTFFSHYFLKYFFIFLSTSCYTCSRFMTCRTGCLGAFARIIWCLPGIMFTMFPISF